MRKLIHEVHRRSLWQVLGIYLAVSWIVLQVVDVIGNNFGLPEWVPPAALILLLIGLPIVVATAFVQEGLSGRDAEHPSRSPAAAGDLPSPPAPEPSGARRLFTWRRALLGGLAAFVLLGTLTGAYLLLRSAGIGPAGTLVAKGLLDDQATLLLTEFGAEDPTLSRAATEAIRIDLAQSNVIRIADPGFVSAALGRMQRDAEARLDGDLGRELAEREGMPGYISGEVTPAGTGYVLTAQIVTTSGEVLVSVRETAGDDAELIGAIDRLSRKLRERIGESLGDLASTPPLERVTTADLNALRTYSRAVSLSDQGENQRAADLLEEVVAADTSFAMAWRKLGMLHVSGGGALGNYSRGVEALGRAYEFRDRLTERERLLAIAGYYGYVEKDARREADAYERMLENDPDDTWALNNLALVLRGDLGDWERAERLLERVLELEDSTTSTPHWNLSVQLGRQARYDDAGAILDSWRRHVPADPLPYQFDAGRAAATRDWDHAVELAREALTIRPGNRQDEWFTSSILANVAAVRGQARDARRHREDAETAAPGPGRALNEALGRVYLDLETRADRAAAIASYDAALERYPLAEMGPLDPPWVRLVELESRLRGADAGRGMLARWEAADPNAGRQLGHRVALSWIDIAGGNAAEATRRLAGVDDSECVDCAYRARVAAWRETGPVDSLVAHAEHYLAMGDLFRFWADASFLAPRLEELGGLYEERGDLEKAASYYAQFVDLWSGADEEFRPRVDAAQARLERILRETG